MKSLVEVMRCSPLPDPPTANFLTHAWSADGTWCLFCGETPSRVKRTNIPCLERKPCLSEP